MSLTKVDKILNWFKNNKIISVIIVLVLISIGLNKFIGSSIENVTFFRSFFNKYVSNRQKVINKIQESSKNEVELKSDKYGVIFENPLTIKNYIVDKMGDQSPAIVAGGNVAISYGVSQKTLDRLLKTLDEKDIDIKDRDAEIQKWIEKYKELESRLALRSTEDTLAAQAKEKLDAGDLEGAEKLLQQSLELKKQNIDKMKKAAASDSYELGLIKELQLDYQGAKNYFKQALEYDSENSEYFNKYGLILDTLGNAKEAVEYFNKALDIGLNVYGENHPDVAIYYNNLGLALDTLGDSKKAIEYYTKALDIDLKVYGENHPQVAIRYNNLGSAWEHLGDAKKAIEYYTKALDINLKVYGEMHPRVAIGYNNLGSAWDTLGDSKKALEYHTKALDIDLKLYGEYHPDVAGVYNNLGSAWEHLGDAKKAIEYYTKALDINLKLYGEMHPHVAIDYNNLGLAWDTLGDAKKAIEYYTKALDINLKLYGEKHPNVATAYNNLGGAWRHLGDAKKAIEYYTMALDIDLKLYGEKHPNVATRYNNLGGAWRHLGDVKKAIEYYTKALDILKATYGDSHPNTIQVKSSIEFLNNSSKSSSQR